VSKWPKLSSGADRIHLDVDGHFVPNIAIGAPIVQSLRRVTRPPLETHLMISNPDFFLDDLIRCKWLTFASVARVEFGKRISQERLPGG
jgi:pentose-5-phosphate-3-epimerase